MQYLFEICGANTSFRSSMIQLGRKINIYLFTTIIIILSFLGDVIESYFKRINNLKNSSNFLPGHGGFFDRFDSFILCISLYSIINNIL